MHIISNLSFGGESFSEKSVAIYFPGWNSDHCDHCVSDLPQVQTVWVNKALLGGIEVENAVPICRVRRAGLFCMIMIIMLIIIIRCCIQKRQIINANQSITRFSNQDPKTVKVGP